MKTSQDIISHLVRKPQNRQIVQKGCIDKLISCLPPQMARAVLFTYIKNRTLFFVLNHPGLKMEFNYKHNLIKSLLKKIKDIDLICKEVEVDEIKSFVSNKIAPPVKPQKIITFHERSHGNFANDAKDETLHALFESIRQEIKKRK